MRRLVALVGDIHGRIARVEGWLAALEAARERPIELVLAVGDVEAYRTAAAHRARAVRRRMTPEFAALAAGARRLARPLYFIGGNNEDFATLHGLPAGGEVMPGVVYLGRAGVRTLAGLRVAWLSGIHRPRVFAQPLAAPTTPARAAEAGYFRAADLRLAVAAHDVDLMLVHEWPLGLAAAAPRRLRAHRFPGAGNPVTRALVDAVRPAWLLCGHSHVPLATTLDHPRGGLTRVACLDQATRPDGALFWIEWDGRRALAAGWGASGQVSWWAGRRWDEALTPADPRS